MEYCFFKLLLPLYLAQLLTEVNNANGKTASYTYNGDGLRMSKTVDGVTTSHIWDGTNIAGDVTNGTVTKCIRGIQLISSKTGSSESFYNYNGHGDVVQLTNSNGSITKQYSYDAFGVEINKDDNDVNPFRYCGEYFDSETFSMTNINKEKEMYLIHMQKTGGKTMRFKLILFIVLASQCFITACSESEVNIDNYTNDCNGGFIVKCNQYLFYNQYAQNSVNLCRYDLTNNKVEYIDNITNKDTNFFGLVKMFVIDNRIYYGKSTSDDNISDIYSVDTADSIPRYEGRINNKIDTFNGEDVETEFKIFKYDNDLYVLARNCIYKLNGSETELMMENVSAIYVNGDEIYYSLMDTDESVLKQSDGIRCYNLKTNRDTDILSKEEIRTYNMGSTVSGFTSGVQNIIADNDSIYFLSCYDPGPISKYEYDGSDKILSLTGTSRTRMFRKYHERIYYIDADHKLCSVNADDGKTEAVVDDEYVYSYNIYDDKIYYYKVTDNRGYPSALMELDITNYNCNILIEF